MHEKSDIQLLRDYAEGHDEAAFRKLVTRSTDLVYSAALRQVESSAVAGDIAQAVFTDLARKARQVAEKMPAESSLAGWLHRSTRYAVLNHLRDTRRRHTNERQAMEQLLTNSESAVDWGQIRPVLDEALDSLGDEDREALLLRFFQKKDFRAVGLALGLSDDTAQKRLVRAVERLREYFSKGKVTIGASGLVVLISANAVQSAPAGLAATISAAAVLTGTAVHTSTVIAATKTIAMTTLQKTLITATVAVLAGAGIYEARQAAQLREQNQTLQQQQAPLAEQFRQMVTQHDKDTNTIAWLKEELAKNEKNNLELLKLRGEVTQLRIASTKSALTATNTTQDMDSVAKAWVARANKLKQRFDETPGANIPELKYANQRDWLAAAKFDLNSEEDYTRAYSQLFFNSKMVLGLQLKSALEEYTTANNGRFPSALSELKPYFKSEIDEAMLARYAVVPLPLKGDPQAWKTGEAVIFQTAPMVPKWERPMGVGMMTPTNARIFTR